jgi:hypothetical protein
MVFISQSAAEHARLVELQHRAALLEDSNALLRDEAQRASSKFREAERELNELKFGYLVVI